VKNESLLGPWLSRLRWHKMNIVTQYLRDSITSCSLCTLQFCYSIYLSDNSICTQPLRVSRDKNKFYTKQIFKYMYYIFWRGKPTPQGVKQPGSVYESWMSLTNWNVTWQVKWRILLKLTLKQQYYYTLSHKLEIWAMLGRVLSVTTQQVSRSYRYH